MSFRLCHGCLEEEKHTPNTFVVDFEGKFPSCCAKADSLEETISYADVYGIVKNVMEGGTRNLLETLASEIVDAVRESIPGFEQIKVCVGKKNPPVGGECQWARIEESWKKND